MIGKRLSRGVWTSLLASLLALAACTGSYVTLAPALLQETEVLGQGYGRACGSLGFAGMALGLVPLGLNSRVERAYDRAVASVPGATALANPTLEESWTWWILMTTHCTTIRGEAVR